MALRWNGNGLLSKGKTRWDRVIVVMVVMMMMMECEGFGNFQMPKFEFPKFGNMNNDSPNKQKMSGGALEAGDTIAVIGASGNVGKLVAYRLSDTYKVNGVVRDVSSVESFFEGRKDRITLFETDLLPTSTSTGATEVMKQALEGANAIVICTGTTAYPTKAWTKNGKEQPQLASNVCKALIDNSFSIPDAMISLDEQGWNTPNNVDDKSNQLLVQTWNQCCSTQKKRIIMLSSIGVNRRDTMPFPILNACGVLTAKAAGESAIMESAKENGYSYTIVRPGQLFGGPYDNNYNNLETLFQLDADTQDITCQQGDTLVGDTLRSTLAEVTAQICEGNYANNMDFAVINTKGDTPSLDTLQQRLSSL